MEYRKDREALVATTPELRQIEAYAAKHRYNRRLSPAAVLLLDPDGSHILVPYMVHEHAMGQRVEPHMRCRAIVKLIGIQEGVDAMMDVAMHYLPADHPPPRMDMKVAEEALESMRAEGYGEEEIDQVMEATWDKGAMEALMSNTVNEATSDGLIEDARIIVGQEPGMPDVSGLVLSTDGERIVGVLPKTRAYDMGLDAASEALGIPVDYEAMYERQRKIDQAVRTRLVNVNAEVADGLVEEGKLSKDEHGRYYMTREQSEMD